MFKGDGLESWDVSKVTSMNSMFEGATIFTGDLSTWDVQQVTSTARMLAHAASFAGDLSRWQLTQVVMLGSMFDGAIQYEQQNLCWTALNADLIIDAMDMFCGTQNASLDPCCVDPAIVATSCCSSSQGACIDTCGVGTLSTQAQPQNQAETPDNDMDTTPEEQVEATTAPPTPMPSLRPVTVTPAPVPLTLTATPTRSPVQQEAVIVLSQATDGGLQATDGSAVVTNATVAPSAETDDFFLQRPDTTDTTSTNYNGEAIEYVDGNNILTVIDEMEEQRKSEPADSGTIAITVTFMVLMLLLVACFIACSWNMTETSFAGMPYGDAA
jgi:Mycoplasma protein of unknown function, DUF285